MLSAAGEGSDSDDGLDAALAQMDDELLKVGLADQACGGRAFGGGPLRLVNAFQADSCQSRVASVMSLT